jgi:hypothetical protein
MNNTFRINYIKYKDAIAHPDRLYKGAVIRNEETDSWFIVMNSNPIVLQSIDLKEEEIKENHIGDYMLNLNSGLMSVYTGPNTVGALSMNFAVSDYQMKEIRALAGVN